MDHLQRTPGLNENLSRDEAAWRARTIQVLSCEVDLDLSQAQDPAVGAYRSRTTLRFRAAGTAATFIDYLKKLLHDIPGKIFLIVDRHSAHTATECI